MMLGVVTKSVILFGNLFPAIKPVTREISFLMIIYGRTIWILCNPFSGKMVSGLVRCFLRFGAHGRSPVLKIVRKCRVFFISVVFLVWFVLNPMNNH